MTITVKRAEGFIDFCSDMATRAEWETAVETLKQASNTTNNMLVDTAVSEAATVVKDLEAQMSASVVVFRIQALMRKRWQELGAEHAPREGDKRDAVLGVNTSTFFDAVAVESILAVNEKTSGAVVDFDPKVEWIPLADEMTDGQYNEFVEKFLELNRGSTSVPFSRAASALTRHSEQSSTSPTLSGSASSD